MFAVKSGCELVQDAVYWTINNNIIYNDTITIKHDVGWSLGCVTTNDQEGA